MRALSRALTQPTGNSNASAVSVGVDTSTSGAKTGTVTLAYQIVEPGAYRAAFADTVEPGQVVPNHAVTPITDTTGYQVYASGGAHVLGGGPGTTTLHMAALARSLHGPRTASIRPEMPKPHAD